MTEESQSQGLISKPRRFRRKKPRPTSLFDTLPTSLWGVILSFLKIEDVFAMVYTSKRYRRHLNISSFAHKVYRVLSSNSHFVHVYTNPFNGQIQGIDRTKKIRYVPGSISKYHDHHLIVTRSFLRVCMVYYYYNEKIKTNGEYPFISKYLTRQPSLGTFPDLPPVSVPSFRKEPLRWGELTLIGPPCFYKCWCCTVPHDIRFMFIISKHWAWNCDFGPVLGKLESYRHFNSSHEWLALVSRTMIRPLFDIFRYKLCFENYHGLNPHHPINRDAHEFIRSTFIPGRLEHESFNQTDFKNKLAFLCEECYLAEFDSEDENNRSVKHCMESMNCFAVPVREFYIQFPCIIPELRNELEKSFFINKIALDISQSQAVMNQLDYVPIRKPIERDLSLLL